MDMKSVGDSLREKVSTATTLVSELKEGGKDKLVEYVNGLMAILPVIKETGYSLNALDIEVSLPPGVNLQFEKVQDVSREKIDAILDAHKDQKMLTAIVSALVAANEFHNKLKLGDFRFTDITVDVSIPPKVHIKFVKK